MARSLPKSTGLVSTTRMPYFFSKPLKKALRMARAHRPAGMVDHDLRRLGRLGLGEGPAGRANGGGTSEQ